MQNMEMDTASSKPTSLRRICIRCFVAIALVIIATDTAPRWQVVTPLQNQLRPVLNLTGLWQGDWPLFAPNPVINNGWISAEFYASGETSPLLDSDNKPLGWNSPIWSECTSWNKFYRFRHMNYFNRAAYRGKDVLDDLSDYIAREKLGSNFHFVEARPNQGGPHDVSLVELRLSKNGLQIVLPEDGTLPSPEETTWIYVGSSLGLRKYAK